jgi:small subunit ribosomal protein S18
MSADYDKNRDDNKAEKPADVVVDYKDVKSLARFISERGKIIPKRVNFQTIKKQKEIARAIKRARILALIPFVSK